jgi:hypothetical protein
MRTPITEPRKADTKSESVHAYFAHASMLVLNNHVLYIMLIKSGSGRLSIPGVLCTVTYASLAITKNIRKNKRSIQNGKTSATPPKTTAVTATRATALSTRA